MSKTFWIAWNCNANANDTKSEVYYYHHGGNVGVFVCLLDYTNTIQTIDALCGGVKHRPNKKNTFLDSYFYDVNFLQIYSTIKASCSDLCAAKDSEQALK